jgi:hypothetical protein
MNRRSFLQVCGVSSAAFYKGSGMEVLLSRSTGSPYAEAIRRTAAMVHDRSAAALAARSGLQIVNLTWEDTGRYKGSAVGPNISDMTIQVAGPMDDFERRSITCMPVLRFPNFSDRTCDLSPSDFTLLVGNHKGRPLKRTSLREVLRRPTRYLTIPGSWKSAVTTLLAERDQKVLVSAQACFLPVPKQGLAEFNPVLFNYQSRRGDPAVLTILATREGTSITVIDNARDAWVEGHRWGQRLFHNQNGKRCSLTGQRLSDYQLQGDEYQSVSASAAGEGGMNMVLLIQVPLKQREEMRTQNELGSIKKLSETGFSRSNADIEAAVIGHGKVEGPFTEIDNLSIQRDPRYPVRVTVQFYQATSNGVVGPSDMHRIAQQLERVYGQSGCVGSLVTDGTTGRITEYDGPKVEPDDWWEVFWKRYTADTGISREEAVRRLQQLLGTGYRTQPVTELYLRNRLREGR